MRLAAAALFQLDVFLLGTDLKSGLQQVPPPFQELVEALVTEVVRIGQERRYTQLPGGGECLAAPRVLSLLDEGGRLSLWTHAGGGPQLMLLDDRSPLLFCRQALQEDMDESWVL